MGYIRVWYFIEETPSQVCYFDCTVDKMIHIGMLLVSRKMSGKGAFTNDVIILGGRGFGKDDKGEGASGLR